MTSFIFQRMVTCLLLLQAVAIAGMWAVSESGHIECVLLGPNVSGSASIWISGGVVSSNWFTGGGGVPGVEFRWYALDQFGKWVVADFGPIPDVVQYHDQGVPVVSGYRPVILKRTDAWRWPFLSVEIDSAGTPQLRKLSLWLVMVVLLPWPLWYFGSWWQSRRPASMEDQAVGITQRHEFGTPDCLSAPIAADSRRFPL